MNCIGLLIKIIKHRFKMYLATKIYVSSKTSSGVAALKKKKKTDNPIESYSQLI